MRSRSGLWSARVALTTAAAVMVVAVLCDAVRVHVDIDTDARVTTHGQHLQQHQQHARLRMRMRRAAQRLRAAERAAVLDDAEDEVEADVTADVMADMADTDESAGAADESAVVAVGDGGAKSEAAAHWGDLKKVGPHVYLKYKATDGQMHWLREYATAMALTVKHDTGNLPFVIHDGVRPWLLIGDAGMSTAPQEPSSSSGLHKIPTLKFDLHPPQPPLTHIDVSEWLKLGEAERHNVLVNSATVRAMNPAATLKTLPGSDKRFIKCHQSVYSALVAAGAGKKKNDQEDAWWAWTVHFGLGGTECNLNIAAEHIVKAATLHHAHEKEWDDAQHPLVSHYERFMNLIGTHLKAVTKVDVWLLRGWLYATDRDNGHRLVAASGFAADPQVASNKGPDIKGTNWEMDNMLKSKDSQGAETYGVKKDTLGHVRPQELGGSRDALNFVPQSQLGQKFVAPAEKLAGTIATYCGAEQGRYTILFGYEFVDSTPKQTDFLSRRPHEMWTVVDLLHDCNGAANGWIDMKAKDDLLSTSHWNAY